MVNWEREASHLLKAELARKGISYKVLVTRLAAMGIKETEGAVSNKLSRGTFRMTFFMQCMAVIGAETVSVAVDKTAK